MTPSPRRLPQSILFLSCDLVGSTRFKQRGELTWPAAFLSFYREFPQALGRLSRGSGLEFRLWKAVGDELVFTVPLRHEKDVASAVMVWLKALDAYEKSSLGPDTGMFTKSGSFIATFPGPDSRVAIPLHPEDEESDKGPFELNEDAFTSQNPGAYLYDYLGPSIDTGFRVISMCDSRFFTMSVEVAWAFCAGSRHLRVRRVPQLTVLESRELKGVWDGRPYPVIAYDRRVDPVTAAFAEANPNRWTLDLVENLCQACADSKGWPSAVYLPDSGFPPFQNMPEDALDTARTNSMRGAETREVDPEPAAGLEESLRRLHIDKPPLS